MDLISLIILINAVFFVAIGFFFILFDDVFYLSQIWLSSRDPVLLIKWKIN